MYPGEREILTWRVSRKLQMNHVSGNSALLIIDDSVREHCRPLFILFFVTKYYQNLLGFSTVANVPCIFSCWIFVYTPSYNWTVSFASLVRLKCAYLKNLQGEPNFSRHSDTTTYAPSLIFVYNKGFNILFTSSYCRWKMMSNSNLLAKFFLYLSWNFLYLDVRVLFNNLNNMKLSKSRTLSLLCLLPLMWLAPSLFNTFRFLSIPNFFNLKYSGTHFTHSHFAIFLAYLTCISLI